MSILEILEAHTQKFEWHPCKCGWKPVFDGRGKAVDQHRTHVAQVLEQHEREAKARAWSNGFHKGRKTENGSHITTWPKNPYRSRS